MWVSFCLDLIAVVSYVFQILMAGDFAIRRATSDDYEAVIGIIEDLWDGNDYLPTMYYVFLQSKRHVLYVAETPADGRVVR